MGALKFKKIGKKIVKNCGGLPLAVRAVASLLRSKTTNEEWTPANNHMLPPFSYNHLPSHPNCKQLKSTEMMQELLQLDVTFPSLTEDSWKFEAPTSLQNLSHTTNEDDVSVLYREISNYPNLLEGIDQKTLCHTPLHTAAETGRTHLALEIMSLKPSLGRVLNHDGFSPLDLALRNGHKETAIRLLRFAPKLIRVQGKERITPLHYVAEAEEIDLLAEFLTKCPASIEDVTLYSETALHIAVKHERLRACKVLFRWLQRTGRMDILNRRDEDGNTVLHVAASKNQTQVAELLVRHVDLNAKNHEGRTALDMADNTRMKQILLRAGALEASKLHQHRTLAEILESPVNFVEKIFQTNAYLDVGLSGTMRNSILVVAILIATVAYQSVLSPAGGVYQLGATNTDTNPMAPNSNQPAEPGEVVMGAPKFYPFLVGNSLAFGASLGIVFLLLPTTGHRILQISLVFLMLGYMYSALTISPATPAAICFVFAGLLVFLLIVAVRMMRKILQRFSPDFCEMIASIYYPYHTEM